MERLHVKQSDQASKYFQGWRENLDNNQKKLIDENKNEFF